MTSADARSKLTHALRLDLVGPSPDDPQLKETLPVPPSRWYLTGFLVPWSAPVRQKFTRCQAAAKAKKGLSSHQYRRGSRQGAAAGEGVGSGLSLEVWMAAQSKTLGATIQHA